jgi:predicted dehydrogenase
MAIRLAAVGTGYFSRFHYRAWKRIPEVELAGIASLSLADAVAAAEAYGGPRGFDDVDAMLAETRPALLDIISPPDTHLAFIALAAKRKVDVICQKAFCRSLEEAREAVALAEAAGIRLIVHENFRFQPWHREIARLLAGDAVGELYQLTFRLRPGDGQGESAYLDRQPYFRSMPRFLVHETAIHLVDVFRFLLGEVRSVYADLRRINPGIAGEDAGVIVFKMASGARAIFDGNRCADHAADNRRLTMGELLVEGSGGSLRLDGYGRIFLRAHGSNKEGQHHFIWADTDFGGDCVYRLQRDVIDCLLSGRTPQNAAPEYLRNLVIEEAIYASSAGKREIDVS